MSIRVVIPARMASERLPGKPLAQIAGVPMIVRVVRQASQSKADSVVVAVDDEQVYRVVADAGYEAMMTSADHASGSDRVMEVVERAGWSQHDVVINVQGDEPLLPPLVIDELAAYMTANTDIEIATLSESLAQIEDFLNPNVVKVVTDAQGKALYFSRAPIPYPRDENINALSATWLASGLAARHIGIYGFRAAALAQFVALPPSQLETIERLEQLRWLDAGKEIYVLPANQPIPGGVDTPADLARVEQQLKAL